MKNYLHSLYLQVMNKQIGSSGREKKIMGGISDELSYSRDLDEMIERECQWLFVKESLKWLLLGAVFGLMPGICLILLHHTR